MKRAWESDGGFWALSEGSQRNENHFLGQGHFASQVKSSYYSPHKHKISSTPLTLIPFELDKTNKTTPTPTTDFRRLRSASVLICPGPGVARAKSIKTKVKDITGF